MQQRQSGFPTGRFLVEYLGGPLLESMSASNPRGSSFLDPEGFGGLGSH